MTCLDTTLLIDLMREQRRNRPGPASSKVQQLLARGERLVTTRINLAELRVGVARAADPTAERLAVEQVVAPLVVLEIAAAAADQFGVLEAHLLALGRPVGDFDVMIASVCLVNGCRLVSRNPKHFADMAGLRIESY